MSTSAHSNVVARLAQMRQLWEQAAENYFEPLGFRLALQNCVTTSRTVTFILQSNKSSIDGFDEWYSAFQERWRQDPIMRWAVEARNTIEKQGDLEMFSQARATIVASYVGSVGTDWVPQALFKSPQEILLSVPSKYRQIQQVHEHGTLIIERRWVINTLPEHEVLSALAHVYKELTMLVNDLRARTGSRGDSVDAEPISMRPLVMDRAVYLAMKDGSEWGLRLFPQPDASQDKERIERRYRKFTDWSALERATTFRDVCDVFFANARGLMLKDGYHRSMALFFKGLSLDQIVGMEHPTRGSRYVIVRELAALAAATGVDGVMLISEAWTAKREDVPPSGYAAEAKRRGEALVMSAADAKGAAYHYEATVERKLVKRDKVKRLGPTKVAEDTAFITVPFQQVWGCADLQAIIAREEQMAAMGIDPNYDERVKG